MSPVEHLRPPAFADLVVASRRIGPVIDRTPVLTCRSVNGRVQASVFFKCEGLQCSGSFKFRGASNAVLGLAKAAAARGVATHSSGNHAAALALAARERGIHAYVVMPENASTAKRNAAAGYGAEIVTCAASLTAREETLAQVLARTGAHAVPPYDDPRIIAGQGTAAMELLDEVPGLDMLLAPVGGGGLISGTAIAAAHLSPKTHVIGVEPALADDAARSLATGQLQPSTYPPTVADGLRVALGSMTFPIIQRHVHAIVTVSETAIIEAMRFIWEEMKIVVEPSAAVPVAALFEGKVETRGLRIGVILSGANVDLRRLPWHEPGTTDS